MMNATDTYVQLESALTLANLEISPSEVHGTVVGAISNHLKSGVSPDLLKLIEPGAAAEEYSQLSESLQEIYRQTSESLLDSDEGFELVLPDDDESLHARVEGLAGWARGYLLGLLHNNAFGIDQLPENGAEIARDILQISEAAAGADGEQQEDWALGELHEYIKVGVQLIFEFIYAERAGNAPDTEQ